MGDNASNNDTMLQMVAEELAKEEIQYDPVLHHLRCNGHIINLSIQAFLFESHLDAFNKNMDSEDEPTEEELANWCRFGPLGKIHNLVKYILQTPQ